MESASPSYTGHRYPVEITAHCVWQYFRFPLGFRQVEELLHQRDVTVSHVTVCRWCLKLRKGRQAQGTERAEQFGGGKHLFGNQTGQRRSGWPVFVLGALRPRRHQTRPM